MIRSRTHVCNTAPVVTTSLTIAREIILPLITRYIYILIEWTSPETELKWSWYWGFSGFPLWVCDDKIMLMENDTATLMPYRLLQIGMCTKLIMTHSNVTAYTQPIYKYLWQWNEHLYLEFSLSNKVIVMHIHKLQFYYYH